MIDDNIKILDETLRIAQEGSFSVGEQMVSLGLKAEEIKKVIHISDEQANELRTTPFVPGDRALSLCRTQYHVWDMDTFEAARRLADERELDHSKRSERMLNLNFANSLQPGGGVRKGARAQEEALCRNSTLLMSIEEDEKPFYETHRRVHSQLASDAMLLSPNVEVIRDREGKLLKHPFVVSVLSCAAPIYGREARDMGQIEYVNLIYKRILCILHVANLYGYKHLVFGAWGCGAFGNDAARMAGLFYKAFKEVSCGFLRGNFVFKNVMFAVLDRLPDKYNLYHFKRWFADFGSDEIRN